jgi:hypothetical protein
MFGIVAGWVMASPGRRRQKVGLDEKPTTAASISPNRCRRRVAFASPPRTFSAERS